MTSAFSATFVSISAAKSTCWSPPPFMSPQLAAGGGAFGGGSPKSGCLGSSGVRVSAGSAGSLSSTVHAATAQLKNTTHSDRINGSLVERGDARASELQSASMQAPFRIPGLPSRAIHRLVHRRSPLGTAWGFASTRRTASAGVPALRPARTTQNKGMRVRHCPELLFPRPRPKTALRGDSTGR